jgi:hypothetical protein
MQFINKCKGVTLVHRMYTRIDPTNDGKKCTNSEKLQKLVSVGPDYAVGETYLRMIWYLWLICIWFFMSSSMEMYVFIL